MAVEQKQKLRFTLGKPYKQSKPITMETIMRKEISIGRKQLQWEASQRINLDYMICTETCGTGAKTVSIAMPRNKRVLNRMETLYGHLVMNHFIYCAVVLGTAIRDTVVRRIVTGSMRISGATTAVFAWLFPFPNLLALLPLARIFHHHIIHINYDFLVGFCSPNHLLILTNNSFQMPS